MKKIKKISISFLNSSSKQQHELQEKFMETQHQVDKYLRENLNFQKAFLSVLDLVSKTNSYFKNEERRALLVRKIGSFVHRILSVFGLTNLSEGYSFSFASGLDFFFFFFRTLLLYFFYLTKRWNSGQSGEAQRKEEILPPYLDTICNFRARVRELAIQKAPPSDLLKECDLVLFSFFLSFFAPFCTIFLFLSFHLSFVF